MGVLEDSKAFRYVQQKSWEHRVTHDQIILEKCPITGCDNWHFYIAFSADKDGLYSCHKCGQNGNLYQLKEYLGDSQRDVTSMRDVASSQRLPDSLPDAEGAHRRLMAEAEDESVEDPALEYLLRRGFTMSIIERYKLGLVQEYGKRWLVIPYYHDGRLVFAKYRTLPPDKKEFRGVSGREAPLFNQDALVKGMEELIVVEGEADTLACLSKGIENVVGVPGANVAKAAWIDKLDELAPKTIYILYDSDQVGQKAARKMAERIGIDKVKNIVLPEFGGKDVNEWFQSGATLEDFEALKREAKQFHVDGVQSVGALIEEIKSDILHGVKDNSRYMGRYEALNKLTGGYTEGNLIGVLAEAKVGKTTWTQNELVHLVETYDESGMMFCQEMQPKILVRKHISMATETDDDKITIDTVNNCLTRVLDYKADMLYARTTSLKLDDVCETIHQAVRRYGVKFLCFDNMQMLLKSLDHVAQESSLIGKRFKQLAMDLKLVLFLIIQPSRVQEGKIVGARNAYGSSSIEKDVDSMICFHRARMGNVNSAEFEAMGFLEVNENFRPELLARVDLSRTAPGGTTTLYLDGAKSKVYSYEEGMAKHADHAMPSTVPNPNALFQAA